MQASLEREKRKKLREREREKYLSLGPKAPFYFYYFPPPRYARAQARTRNFCNSDQGTLKLRHMLKQATPCSSMNDTQTFPYTLVGSMLNRGLCLSMPFLSFKLPKELALSLLHQLLPKLKSNTLVYLPYTYEKFVNLLTGVLHYYYPFIRH